MGCLNSVTTGNKYTSKNSLIQVGARKIIKQNLIAEGAYGEVWKCLQPATDQIYGLKLMRLQTQELKQMFQKQVAVLTQMSNNRAKNVVKLYESARYVTQEWTIGLLLLQFSHMNLYQQINNKRFNQRQIIKILLQIVNGVQQLHSQKIYHLDIKPQNIILCSGQQYKICDLGSCIQKQIDFTTLNKRQKAKIQQFIESNSTLIYRSPEMIFTDGKIISQKSDIWMVGLIGYMMLYRKHPFENKGKTSILCPIQFPTEGRLQNILKKMLQIQIQFRISLKQLKQQLLELYKQIN